MKGRKPTPPSLKVITGNPGKRKIKDGVEGLSDDIPDCPVHLPPVAKEEWARIIGHLSTARLVTQIDMAALAAYCANYARWVEAELMLQKSPEQGGGVMVTTPNGYQVQSPWVAIAKGAMEQMKSFATEFGMTPSARARVSSSGQGSLFPEDDPMEAFLKASKRG